MGHESSLLEDLAALRSLSSLQPLHSVERSLAAIVSLGPARSGRFLELLRMRTLVMSRLAPYEDRPGVRPCMEVIRPKAESIARMHKVLDANLETLDRIARDTGLRFYAIKGLGARVTYPDPSFRDFSDLDVFVRTRAEASVLVRALREEFGYQYLAGELPWIKYDPADGLVYGQFPLVVPDGADDLLNVDIHFGDYSVRHSSRLGLTEQLPSGEPGLCVLAPEENLACVVNNAAGDYFVTAKDTNDLLMALSLPEFDVPRFAARLRQSGLEGFLGFIVDQLRAGTTLTREQEERLRLMPAVRTLEPAPDPLEPDWNRRCLGTTVHAFGAGWRRGGLLPALREAYDAYGYYRDRLSLSAVPDAGAESAAPFGLNPWTCVRLVPVDIAEGLLPDRSGASAPVTARPRSLTADPGIQRVDTPSGQYVRIEGETFLVTVDYALPEELIRGAAPVAAPRA
ncbi:nucleotidyltransferase family protein [Streptomyces sp. SID10815]|uniref:nucleotidyltransferase family protein n=1 Tax=Streptomyces sp. SID10815 TaxID=2706027 RepID=UPI0013CB4E6C|nr:nucleotidyltransferase family protein [Streptomyces sp. SID10815]NEA49350.1 nucleotidyltransferase family protein [Streptomyces sp. SID10815]